MYYFVVLCIFIVTYVPFWVFRFHCVFCVLFVYTYKCTVLLPPGVKPIAVNKYVISILHILSVCSLTYPAVKAHASYCHLWPVWLYHIFPHYLIKGTLLGGEKS